MTLNRVLLACLLLGLAGWWFSTPRRAGDLPAAVHAGSSRCPLPPSIRQSGAPLQSDVPGGMASFPMAASKLVPLAGFSLDGRVLSRRDYSSGREADWSPTDLALGWDGMARDEVIDGLDISQSGRWYRYRWQNDPPLPLPEIARSSANMHMIPSSTEVARTLAGIKAGQRVRIDGWLVEVQADDGWRWRSSTSRTDTGGGACEVVYVCGISAL
ncbi:hypothetical protein MNQ95_10435 [Pseudoxanthomonas daejeonensis]|uniref:hypothetical protein n=1 Tax=Pseudoxanthomonas daejeonensis TaxID=266062 RepID=UPI001F546DB9|nr:hypothetical protein [Pseudoxanthomonas daejeonensis]UNK56575.1 hypothetical protein MNQ95_10435 [Pseudoxanthomonas daejeonensis]